MFVANKGGLSVCADLQDLTAEIDALEVGFANTGPFEVGHVNVTSAGMHTLERTTGHELGP